MEGKNRRNIPIVFVEAFKETVKDQYQNIAASLAYYLFLSLAPLIGFSIFLADKILGEERTVEHVIPFLKSYFSPPFVSVIMFFLHRNKHVESDGLLTLSILAGIAMAYSTKEYFGMVKDAVELTWNKRGDKFGLINFFKRIVEDLSVAFFALIIIVIFILFGTLWPHQNYSAVPASVFERIGLYVSEAVFEYLLFFVLFFFCFYLLPPVKVYWKNALIPAIVASSLQVVGREILKAYTMNQDIGLAESLLVVLFWFYYSSLAFIYSSEFAKVYISSKQNIDYKKLHFAP